MHLSVGCSLSRVTVVIEATGRSMTPLAEQPFMKPKLVPPCRDWLSLLEHFVNSLSQFVWDPRYRPFRDWTSHPRTPYRAPLLPMLVKEFLHLGKIIIRLGAEISLSQRHHHQCTCLKRSPPRSVWSKERTVYTPRSSMKRLLSGRPCLLPSKNCTHFPPGIMRILYCPAALGVSRSSWSAGYGLQKRPHLMKADAHIFIGATKQTTEPHLRDKRRRADNGIPNPELSVKMPHYLKFWS